MYCRLIDGSLVTLSKAKYARTDPQVLSTYHVPLSDINGAIPLGLDWQTWTISGVIADSMSVRWRDIIWLSLDNVSWRACRVQATAFPTNNYQQSLYELTVLVSPILEGPIVRYPSSGYKWGNQSITGISQAGNVSAYPTIHFLAPLFYAPLSNTLLDFAGQAVTFKRTGYKVHAGVTYAPNVPIFDAGLYLASDGSLDVATWTPPASTLRTIALQIKQTRFPSPWVIGAGVGTANLLTPNQSNAETGTTGMGSYGTLTRNTVSPIAGAGDFKVVAIDTGAYLDTSGAKTSVYATMWYACQFLAKGTGSGSVAVHLLWYAANGTTFISESVGTGIAISTTATLFKAIFKAPAGAAFVFCRAQLDSGAVGNVLEVDSLMLEAISQYLTVWNDIPNGINRLDIDTVNNLLRLFDSATTVSAVFPTATYMAGIVTDIVVEVAASKVVTVVAHAAGGTWYTATGTLGNLDWVTLTLGNLEGNIANLIMYPYVLTAAEYQALAYSSLSLLFNSLSIGNRYAGEIVKGSDKRLVNANGSDISALLGGTDIAIGATSVTIAQSQGLSARWYVELKRTDV